MGPDFVVKDNTRKICLQIDMSVPTDINISVKEYNKIIQACKLILKMWHFKTTAVPVIAGAQGIIKKGTEKHIQQDTRRS